MGEGSGPIEITGLMLTSVGEGDIVVSVEVDGKWVECIREWYIEGGVISYILEPLGIRKAAKRKPRA